MELLSAKIVMGSFVEVEYGKHKHKHSNTEIKQIK